MLRTSAGLRARREFRSPTLTSAPLPSFDPAYIQRTQDPFGTKPDPSGPQKDPSGPFRDLFGTPSGPGLDPLFFHTESLNSLWNNNL